MVDPKDIQATCDDIVREFAPLKITSSVPMLTERLPRIRMLTCWW